MVLPLIIIFATSFQTAKMNKAFADGNSQIENRIISRPIIAENSDFEIEKSNAKLPFEIPTDEAQNFGATITIESVGIDTQIYESKNSTSALDLGVWRVPEYGFPGDAGKYPIMLASHRWGMESLSWDYRAKNLFLNLPEVKIGDEIVLNWENKEYKYKVSYIEDNEYLSRQSDLILLTCRNYNSNVRVFVYADLVE